MTEAVAEELEQKPEQQANEALKVTLTIMRENPRADDFRVAFTVKPESNAYFEAALRQVLAASNPEKVEIEEVLDAETKKPCRLLIKVHGRQQNIVGVFQMHANNLRQHCSEVQ